jgi:hypothetical protein
MLACHSQHLVVSGLLVLLLLLVDLLWTEGPFSPQLRKERKCCTTIILLTTHATRCHGQTLKLNGLEAEICMGCGESIINIDSHPKMQTIYIALFSSQFDNRFWEIPPTRQNTLLRSQI